MCVCVCKRGVGHLLVVIIIINILFNNTYIGMLFTYLLCQMSLWWLFHTSSLFWKVLFPFHSRSFEVSGRIKHIHISCAVIGIVLPFIPIITSMSKFAADVHGQANNESSPGELFLSGGLGFTFARFPALLCVGSNKNAVFYSLVLPIDLILAIGCTLLLIMFWSVHKVSNKYNFLAHLNPNVSQYALIICLYIFSIIYNLGIV